MLDEWTVYCYNMTAVLKAEIPDSMYDNELKYLKIKVLAKIKM